MAERCARPTTRASSCGICLDAVQLGERARDRECELRARAEPDVRRQRAMHPNARAARQPVMPNHLRGEGRDALRVVAFHLEPLRIHGRHQQGRRRRRRADAAEPAAERAAQVEHAEVETGGRLDEDCLLDPAAHAGEGSVLAGAASTNAVSSAIASCSSGPAVLSTITCSRTNSLATNSRGSRWRRVA